MDWWLEMWFYFGLLCLPGVPLLLLAVRRRHPFTVWSGSVALLVVALVAAGFPVASVVPAGAVGLLIGFWAVEELA